jgi:hypothetical protein
LWNDCKEVDLFNDFGGKPMTTASSILTPDLNTDAGYQWYLENLDEIVETKTRLQILTDIETDLSLPLGTALRFEALYSDAIAVSPHEDERYATTWDSFHVALSGDPTLAILAHEYHQTSPLILHVPSLRPHGLVPHKGRPFLQQFPFDASLKSSLSTAAAAVGFHLI